MSDPTALRVSDEDRDRAAREFRDHFAAGRLTDEELSDRLSEVYRARTAEELQRLRSDLPLLATHRRAELAERRSELQRRLLQQTGGAVIPFLICTVIWLASGADGEFWPIWVAIFPVIALIRNGWRLYGPAPELDRVEEELERRERREQLRGAHRARAHDRAIERGRRPPRRLE